MTKKKSKFNFDLPKGMSLMEASFDIIFDDNSGSFTAKICDEGAGAFIKLKTQEESAFNPEELTALCDVLQDAVAFIDGQKERK